MRRKFFFLMEKLEIKRNERIAMSVLLIFLVTTSSIWTFQQSYANYDEKHYQELEEIFKQKSKELQDEKDVILAQYAPESDQPLTVSVAEEPAREFSHPDTSGREQQEENAGDLLNINEANSEQLRTLPGIGPAYARRIIEWRDENGAFTSKDQLLEIKGIGEKRLAQIKPLITF